MTATRLHEFNTRGIERFRVALAALRDHPDGPVPFELLEDPKLANPFEPPVELDRPGFRTRRDAAEYLEAKLGRLPDGRVMRNAGLWTWLSLYYFDDVCPATAGTRRVLGDEKYIYAIGQLDEPRHLLALSDRILRTAGEHSRLLLDRPLHRLDLATQTIAGNLRLLRIPCMFEVLDRLYYDEDRRRPKPRIAGTSVTAGDLNHRLPRRIYQLQKTYDLHVLKADQLLKLLGAEFEPWLEKETPADHSTGP